MSHHNGLDQEAEGTPIRGAHHPCGQLIKITVKDCAL